MSGAGPRIVYPPRRLSGPAAPGGTLHESLRGLGHVLDYACGGNALCGTCCVRVVRGMRGLTPVGPEEAARLADLELAAPHRLACQARLLDDGEEIVLLEC